MKFSEIAARVGGIPHMLPWQGEFVYRLILEDDIEQVLELGVAHGTSALYMAAALHEKGCGKVIAIDRQQALSLNPNIIELSKKTGLDEFIEPVFAHTTYNWELMKLLEQHSEPFLDFCYLDGAHNFETDTCAFFLIDRLLKPGGCILFDDVSWSYAKSAT